MTDPLTSKEIEAHYAEAKEADRLSGPYGELEQLRTQAILTRHLPAPPAVIFDIGGAAGAYAFALAEKSYAVHLIDPVDLHLDQARNHSASSGVPLASITKGDARNLAAPSNTADAVLLLGPLYHLIERTDRVAALREARRILKPRGLLFAAAISRFASLIDGFARGFFQDREFREIVAKDLATGQHRNPTNRPVYFTTAYFHRPEDLTAEIREAGFTHTEILAVEGPVWSTPHFPLAWADPSQRRSLMEFLSKIEGEPSALGASAHFIAVARND